MASNRIALVRDGRPREFGVGSPLQWSSAETPWSGFTMEAHLAPHPTRWSNITTHFAQPVVLLYTGGRALLQYRIGSKTYDRPLRPGMVRVLMGEYDMKLLSWSGAHSMLAVQVAGGLGSAGLHADDSPVWSGLDQHLAVEDAQVSALLRGMYAEIEAGCPAGRMYGESLSAALAAYLHGRYVTKRPSAPEAMPHLATPQVRRVLDYIHDRLHTELGVGDLAATLGLSPHYFSYLFKNTFGVSPYQFVLRKRVEQAKRLLRTDMPIAEIATSVGFSSQSHFTSAFRRLTGGTPRSYRR